MLLKTQHLTPRSTPSSHTHKSQAQYRTAVGRGKSLYEYLTQPGPRTLQVLILLALLLMWAWFVLTFPPASHWTAACALLLNQLADSSRVLYTSCLHVDDAGSTDLYRNEGQSLGGNLSKK